MQQHLANGVHIDINYRGAYYHAHDASAGVIIFIVCKFVHFLQIEVCLKHQFHIIHIYFYSLHF